MGQGRILVIDDPDITEATSAVSERGASPIQES